MEQMSYGRVYIILFQVLFFCVFIIHCLLFGCGHSSAEPGALNKIATGNDWKPVPRGHMQLPANTTLKRDPENGTVAFLQGNNLSEIAEQNSELRELEAMEKHAETAVSFIDCYKSLFLLQEPFAELTVETINKENDFKHIRLQQVYRGLKVLRSEIIVHLNRENHVYLMQGRYNPTPRNLNLTPALNRAEAYTGVASALNRSDSKFEDCTAELAVFISATHTPHLVYRILIQASVMNGWEFIIDAHTGKILEKISTTNTQKIGGRIE